MKANLVFPNGVGARGTIVRSGSLCLLGLLVAGCPGSKPASEAGSGTKVLIRGSNTFGEELAPRLIAEYKKDHPKVAIDLETKGSGSGFWGLIAGVCDIAASSRL